MASISTNLSRVSTAMSSSLLLNNVRRGQVEVLRLQEQLSGRRINRPSDEPESVGILASMRRILSDFDQRIRNLNLTSNVVDVTDQALGEANELILQAQNIASAQAGLSDAVTRRGQAEIIDGILDTFMSIANRDFEEVHLFAGRASKNDPFVTELGGFRYTGETENMQRVISNSATFDVNSNGVEAFGAVSGRVVGGDLNPSATPETRLIDVNGARNAGVTLGAVNVVINGVKTPVDLSGADSMGDVADLINVTLGAAGTLAVTADGFSLTAGPGDIVSVEDIGTGITAADLGIAIGAIAGGTTPGADVDPKLTPLTGTGSLTGGIDLTSGLAITNGGKTVTVDFSGAQTIEDMMNLVDRAAVGARLVINSDGNGLSLLNEISGTEMSVGENGGTTAADLGLQTFGAATALADLNHGNGVRRTTGAADIRISLHDGTAVDVNLDGAVTVGDVIASINTAGGGSVTAALASSGNGIVLTDATAGGADFTVRSLNSTYTAEDLGLDGSAGSGSTVNSGDVGTVRTESVMTHLIMLRDALLNNDTRAITEAGELLNGDVEVVASVRARTGIRSIQIHDEIARTETRRLQTESLLSDVQDTEMTEAITRFNQYEQQLQATLLAGQRIQQLSLLNFLR
ncbi:MAG: flagellin N-terminal helical domain-containing protein [Planctomycetota bacterium]|jgi:flagellin-like hook-associated protein FlgL